MHCRQTKEDNSEESYSQQDIDYLNPLNTAEQEKRRFSSEKNIVDTLCYLLKQQSAPNIEVDVFDGNLLSFHYFMTIFHEVEIKRIGDPSGRLARLLKYINSNEKEMIKHYVQEPSTLGYQHARKMQVEKYVNRRHVMVKYRKEIKPWVI